MFHETQRFEIFDGIGFERRAGFQAIDEMRDDTVEARLVAAIPVVDLASWRVPE